MIEASLAKAMHALRLMERMLHSDDEWSIEIAGEVQPAVVEVHEDRLVLKSYFEFELSTLSPVNILANGEVVFVLPEQVFCGPSWFAWKLSMGLPLTA
jgi:hypothetical protein